MLTDLLTKTQTGVTYYRDTYPEMYRSYEKELNHLQSQIDGLLRSIRFCKQETPKLGDPITGLKAA